jgi:uncharacterized membrane protein YebE (DUF533 family)
MFDAQQLLGALMQGGLGKSSEARLNHALGERGLGGSGGFLEQLMGGSPGGGSSGNMLGGLADLARSMLGGAGQAVKRGDPGAMGGLGALAGALLGGGSGSAKGALGGGVMALLGSLALNALRGTNRQAFASSEGQLGVRPPTSEAESEALQSRAMLVVQAMINAAKADGEIDNVERQRIIGKLEEAGTEAEARAFVERALREPSDTEGLIRAVPNEEVGAQVYAASLLAIEVDTKAEQEYLRHLAQGLRLEPGIVDTLHKTLGV